MAARATTAAPPAATPATIAAFSPASANANPNGTLALGLGGAPGLGFGSNFSMNGFAAGPSAAAAAASTSPQQLYHPQGFAERRNSLNGLVAAHFSNSLLQSSDASGGTGTGAGTGIDVDDLVSLGGGADADEVNSANDSHLEVVGDGETTAVPPTTTGSAEEGRDAAAASSFPNASSQLVPFPTAASTAPSLNGTAGTQAPAAASAAVGTGPGGGELSVDPLVAAITRSLAKLVAEGSATLVDEASSSSDGGGDGEEVHPHTATGEEGEETDGDDGAETPLSSGASRTGSMRRRYFC